ncbi:MAG: polymer-forming cytoskeletal protein [Betaproteobacteria bacterium]
MFINLGRRDRPDDAKDPAKSALKPALYDLPGTKPAVGAALRPGAPPTLRDMVAPPAAAPPAALPAVAEPAAPAAPVVQPAGSKLSVGINIKLKGVEVSDCDVLVIEGHVEATVHSKALEIAEPGTLKGTAMIDVAEIRGEFAGDLTARTRLVVHGTGRVSGTIRYGKLIVAEGGEISGDVKRIDPAAAPSAAPTARAPTAFDPRTVLRPAPEDRLV